MTEDEQFEANDKYSIADLHKTAPENIWLQIDQEANPIDGWEFKTWCEYEVNDNDLEYVRADLVESLRQQLAAALAACKLKDEAITSQMKVTSWEEQAWANDLSEKALAIQLDDISGVILCHAEPVGYDVTTMDGKKMLMRSFCNIVGHKSELLYRAWEPTK